MKRFLAIILSFSLLISCLVFAPGITSSAASPVTREVYGETLEVTDVSSFSYAVPKLASDSGTLATQLVRNTVIKQPLHDITSGWDGTYVISSIDGSAGEAKKLYNQLVAQTPEGEKPVIAAWIFTHAHNDHIGNFNEFSMHYSDDIELERIVYNFPSEEEIATKSPDMLGTDIGEYATFKRVLEEYYSDDPITKAHTGNRFYIRNAEFEVMQTFEDFYPTNLADHNFNTTSVIYRMQLEGQSFMWMGDSTPASESKLVEQFGSYIKSDVLQLSHHGIDGTLSGYQTVDPEYVLWGAAKLFYYQYASSEGCFLKAKTLNRLW